MEVPGYDLSNRHGHKVGRVGALLVKTKFRFLCREGPHFDHSTFYRSLKVRFPLDVGVSRDGRVNTELGTGSLKQAVGILTPEDFRPIVDTE